MIIYKYTINPGYELKITVPIGSNILDIQRQGKVVSMWVLCSNSEETEERDFYIYATGEEIKHDPGSYIATFQIEMFVFHVFEKVKS